MTLLENKRTELEKLIGKAINKVQGLKESDLCKYLPGPTGGGYMHHFTLRKLKITEPSELLALLQKFIMDTELPKVLNPKPRAPRGSRKRSDFLSFSRTDIEKILTLAEQTGDRDLIARFTHKRPLAVLKKDLIRSIRSNLVCQELWNAYSTALTPYTK